MALELVMALDITDEENDRTFAVVRRATAPA